MTSSAPALAGEGPLAAPAFLDVTASVSGRTWRSRPCDEALGVLLARRLGAPDIVGRLLAGRGVQPEELDAFLTPTLRALFPDPSAFADMDTASAAILDAIIENRRLAIFADYDVDGGTASAILTRYLRAWGREPILYVPDRLKEGFGPTPGAFQALKAAGVDLVVTVDCGAAAAAALATAAEIGLDVVVMDHHLMHDPAAASVRALVNPNRPDCASGHGHLAAAGVVFVLVVALNRLARERGVAPAGGLPDPMAWLDLAALGTLCDMAPLKGVNRAIVQRGLAVLQRLENPGLKALAQAAGVEAPKSVYDATFALGPRLNAGGRLGDPWLAARLLATDDPEEAGALAAELHAINEERKAVEASVLAAAVRQAEAQADAPILVVGGEGWHPGVVGIVAGRLKDRFHKPAIVAGWGDGLGPVGRGSGRSVPGINLGDLVSEAAKRGLILGGGGHAMAAGLTLSPDQLPGLRDWMAAQVAGVSRALAEARVLEIDAVIAPRAANGELMALIERLGPFGSGAPEPLFAAAGVRTAYPRRVGENHLAFDIQGPDGARLRAIAFRMANGPAGEALASQRKLHIAGRLKPDAWRGEGAVQMEVVDVAFAD
jgi:single-stranded-DNA-specific exonuclease